MRDMRLKKSALDFLQLPLEIVYGCVQELELTVPWRSLSSSPVVITLRGVYACAVLNRIDSASEQKRTRTLKEKRIKEAELLSNSKDAKLQATMLSKILANLKITIEDIHIHIREPGKLTGSPFSCGMTIKRVEAHTTDANGKEAFVIPTARVHKVGRVDDLAFYWNPNPKPWPLGKPDVLLRLLQNPFSRDGSDGSSGPVKIKVGSGTWEELTVKQYLLWPLSASARVLMQVVLRDLKTPHYDVGLELDNVRLSFSESQVRDLTQVASSISRMRLRAHVDSALRGDAESAGRSKASRVLRPPALLPPYPAHLEEVADGPAQWAAAMRRRRARQWWKYAYNSVRLMLAATAGSTGSGDARRQRVDYDVFFDQKRAYVDVFRRKTASWLPDLTEREQTELAQLEDALSADTIIYFRRLARAEVTAEEAERNKAYLWAGTTELTVEQRRKLYATINYDEAISESQLPVGFVKVRVGLKLHSSAVTISDGRGDRIASLCLSGSAKLRDAVGSRSVSLTVSSLTLADDVVRTTKYPFLLYSEAHNPRAYHNRASAARAESKKQIKKREAAAKADILRVEVTLRGAEWGRGVDAKAGTSRSPPPKLEVSVRLQELCIVYKPLWWCALQRFLEGTHIVGPKASKAAATQWTSWQAQRQADLMEALSGSKSKRIQLHIGSPRILLPSNEMDVVSPVLVADLGTLTVGPGAGMGSSGAVASEGGERVAAERVQASGVVKMEHRVTLADARMQVVKSYIDLDLIDEMNVEESRPGLSREVDTRVTTVVGSFGVGMHLITCPQESALENPNFEVSAKLPRLFVQLTPDAVGTIMRLSKNRRRIWRAYKQQQQQRTNQDGKSGDGHAVQTAAVQVATVKPAAEVSSPKLQKENARDTGEDSKRPSVAGRMTSGAREMGGSGMDGRDGDLKREFEAEETDIEAFAFNEQMFREEQERSERQRDFLRGNFVIEVLEVLVSHQTRAKKPTKAEKASTDRPKILTADQKVFARAEPVVRVRIDGLRYGAALNPLKTRSDVSLARIFAADLRHPQDSPFRALISSAPPATGPEISGKVVEKPRDQTRRASDLLFVTVRTVARHSPVYAGVDSFVDTECNYLSLSWNPGTVKTLTDFYLRSIEHSHLQSQPASPDSPTLGPSNGAFDEAALTAAATQYGDPQSVKISGRLQKLEIQLNLPSVQRRIVAVQVLGARVTHDTGAAATASDGSASCLSEGETLCTSTHAQISDVRVLYLSYRCPLVIFGRTNATSLAQAGGDRGLDSPGEDVLVRVSVRRGFCPKRVNVRRDGGGASSRKLNFRPKFNRSEIRMGAMGLTWAEGLGASIYNYWSKYVLRIAQVTERRAAEIRSGIAEYAESTLYQEDTNFSIDARVRRIEGSILAWDAQAASPTATPAATPTTTSVAASPTTTSIAATPTTSTAAATLARAAPAPRGRFREVAHLTTRRFAMVFNDNALIETQIILKMADLLMIDCSQPIDSKQRILVSSHSRHLHHASAASPKRGSRHAQTDTKREPGEWDHNLIRVEYLVPTIRGDGGKVGAEARRRAGGVVSDKYMSLDMRQAAMQWNPATVQMLSILFLGDSEPPPNEEEDASSRARAQTLEAVGPPPAVDLAAAGVRAAQKADDGGCDWCFSGSIELVQIQFNKPGRPLARLNLRGADFTREIYASHNRWIFAGAFESISLVSLIPELTCGSHTQLLRCRGKPGSRDAMRFESVALVRRDPDVRPSTGWDSKFTLEMPHSMQVDMVYQPLMEVWDYFNEGVLGTMYAYAADAVTGSIRMQHFLLFEVTCPSVSLRLPADPANAEHARVELGAFRLWNALDEKASLRTRPFARRERSHWAGDDALPKRTMWRLFVEANPVRLGRIAGDLQLRVARSMLFNAKEWFTDKEPQVVTEIELRAVGHDKKRHSGVQLTLAKSTLILWLKILYKNIKAEMTGVGDGGDAAKRGSGSSAAIEYKYANPEYVTLAGEMSLAMRDMRMALLDENGPLALLTADSFNWRYAWILGEQCLSANSLILNKLQATDTRLSVAGQRVFRKLLCPWGEILSEAGALRESAPGADGKRGQGGGSEDDASRLDELSDLEFRYTQQWPETDESALRTTILFNVYQPCGYFLPDLYAKLRRYLRPITWWEGLDMEEEIAKAEEADEVMGSWFNVKVQNLRMVFLSNPNARDSMAMVLSSSNIDYIFRPSKAHALGGTTIFEVFDMRVYACMAQQLAGYADSVGESFSFVNPFGFNVMLTDRAGHSLVSPDGKSSWVPVSTKEFGPQIAAPPPPASKADEKVGREDDSKCSNEKGSEISALEADETDECTGETGETRTLQVQRELAVTLLDSLEVRMSYHNMLMLRQIANNFDDDADGADDAMVEQGQKISTEDTKSGLALLEGPAGVELPTHSPSDGPPLKISERSYQATPMPKNDDTPTEQIVKKSADDAGVEIVVRTARCVIPGVRLVLLDDRSGHRRPLVRATLRGFEALGGAAGGSGDSYSLESKLKVAAEYYDAERVCWPPLLLPLTANVIFRGSPKASPPTVSISASIKDTVSARVESRLFATLLAIKEIFEMEDLKRVHILPARRFRTRYLRNTTRSDLWFWADGTEPQRLRPGQETSLDFEELGIDNISGNLTTAGPRSAGSDGKTPSMPSHVYLQLEGWLPLRTDVTRARQSYVRLEPATLAHKESAALVDIVVRHGSFIVTVRSSFAIRNNTSTTLQVQLTRPGYTSSVCDMTIAPGETGRVPVSFTNWETLRLRPVFALTSPDAAGGDSNKGSAQRFERDGEKQNRDRRRSAVVRHRRRSSQWRQQQWLSPEVVWSDLIENASKRAEGKTRRSVDARARRGSKSYVLDVKATAAAQATGRAGWLMTGRVVGSGEGDDALTAFTALANLSWSDNWEGERATLPTALFLSPPFRVSNKLRHPMEIKLTHKHDTRGRVLTVAPGSDHDITNLVLNMDTEIQLRVPPHRWSRRMPVRPAEDGTGMSRYEWIVKSEETDGVAGGDPVSLVDVYIATTPKGLLTISVSTRFSLCNKTPFQLQWVREVRGYEYETRSAGKGSAWVDMSQSLDKPRGPWRWEGGSKLADGVLESDDDGWRYSRRRDAPDRRWTQRPYSGAKFRRRAIKRLCSLAGLSCQGAPDAEQVMETSLPEAGVSTMRLRLISQGENAGYRLLGPSVPSVELDLDAAIGDGLITAKCFVSGDTGGVGNGVEGAETKADTGLIQGLIDLHTSVGAGTSGPGSKVVVISPRMVIVNKTKHSKIRLYQRLDKTPASRYPIVAPGGRAPFYALESDPLNRVCLVVYESQTGGARGDDSKKGGSRPTRVSIFKSLPFPWDEVGERTIRLCDAKREHVRLMRVNVSVDYGMYSVSVSYESVEEPTYLVENDTDYVLKIRQERVRAGSVGTVVVPGDDAKALPTSAAVNLDSEADSANAWTWLLPRHRIAWGWVDLMQDQPYILEVLGPDGSVASVRLDEIGWRGALTHVSASRLKELSGSTGRDAAGAGTTGDGKNALSSRRNMNMYKTVGEGEKGPIKLRVVARGVTKVLSVRPRRATSDSGGRAASIGSAGAENDLEESSDRAVRTLDMRLGISIGGLSIALHRDRDHANVTSVRAAPKHPLLAELFCERVEGSFRVENWEYGSSRHAGTLAVHRFQVMDLDPDAKFPVVLLSPRRDSDAAAGKGGDWGLAVKGVCSYNPNAPLPITVFDSLDVLMRKEEHEIKLHERFITNLIDYAAVLVGGDGDGSGDERTGSGSSTTTQPRAKDEKSRPPTVRRARTLSLRVEGPGEGADGATRLYHFHRLFVSPLKCLFTLSMDPNSTMLKNRPLMSKMAAIFANLRDTDMRMRALMLTGSTRTTEELSLLLADHYLGQCRRQVVKVIGSSAVLGSPLGLYKDFEAGFTGFYRAMKRARHKPQSAPLAMLEGTGNLVGNIVSGVGKSASGITDTLGRGLAALSMDKAHQERRAQSMKDHEPTWVGDGVFMGVGRVLEGVARGVSGIFVDPYLEARAGGVKGFFKGVGKGILGVVTKPVGGAMDGVSTITKGVANTGTLLRVRENSKRSTRSSRAATVRQLWDAQEGGTSALDGETQLLTGGGSIPRRPPPPEWRDPPVGYYALFGTKPRARQPCFYIAHVDSTGARKFLSVLINDRAEFVTNKPPNEAYPVENQRFAIEYQDFLSDGAGVPGGWVGIRLFGKERYLYVDATRGGQLRCGPRVVARGGRLARSHLFRINTEVPGFASASIRCMQPLGYLEMTKSLRGRIGARVCKTDDRNAKPYPQHLFEVTLCPDSFVALRQVRTGRYLSMPSEGSPTAPFPCSSSVASGLAQTFRVGAWSQQTSDTKTMHPLPSLTLANQWMPAQGVVRAEFGTQKRKKRVDVTTRVRRMLKGGYFVVGPGERLTDVLGVPSPAKNKISELKIVYRRGLQQRLWSYVETAENCARGVRRYVGRRLPSSRVLIATDAKKGMHSAFTVEPLVVDDTAGFALRAVGHGGRLQINIKTGQVAVNPAGSALDVESLFQLVAAYPASPRSVSQDDIKTASNFVPLVPRTGNASVAVSRVSSLDPYALAASVRSSRAGTAFSAGDSKSEAKSNAESDAKSDAKSGQAGLVAAGGARALRLKLEEFYKKFNPDNVPKAAMLAARYDGREGALNKQLRRAYGMDLSSMGTRNKSSDAQSDGGFGEA